MLLRAIILATASLAVAAILWQRHVITGMAEQAERQARQIGEVTAANAGLAESLDALREARTTDNEVVLRAAVQADRLSLHAAALEHRLHEALYAAQTVDIDAPLPFDIVHALCLRYRVATGRVGLDLAPPASDAATGAAARTGNPPAATCDGWRALSLRQVVEWAGYLLDHAGLERNDKSALRAWAKERE